MLSAQLGESQFALPHLTNEFVLIQSPHNTSLWLKPVHTFNTPVDPEPSVPP